MLVYIRIDVTVGIVLLRFEEGPEQPVYIGKVFQHDVPRLLFGIELEGVVVIANNAEIRVGDFRSHELRIVNFRQRLSLLVLQTFTKAKRRREEVYTLPIFKQYFYHVEVRLGF